MTVASTDQVAAAAGPAPAQPIRKDAGDKRAILLLAVAISIDLPNGNDLGRWHHHEVLAAITIAEIRRGGTGSDLEKAIRADAAADEVAFIH